MGATMEAAVEDDAGGDAGPDGEIGEVVDLAEDTPAVEAEGRGTDVVLEDTRPADRALELVAESQVRPAEVDGQGHRAGQRVDPAGTPMPTASTSAVVPRPRGASRRRPPRCRPRRGLGPAATGAMSLARTRSAPSVDEHGDLRAADIHTDQQRPPAFAHSMTRVEAEVAVDGEPRRASAAVIVGPPARARR